MVSFSFSHSFLNKPEISEKKNLAYQIVYTFKKLDLGDVDKVNMSENFINNQWNMIINVYFLKWNNKNPTAENIYNNIYIQDENNMLPNCSKLVYDHNTWILWKCKELKNVKKIYLVTWSNTDFTLEEFSIEECDRHVDGCPEINADHRKFYEQWADELSKMNECNYDIGVEYRYDLMYMIYDIDSDTATTSGYIAYSYDDFINYYSEEEGKMRWNSDIYTSFAYNYKDGLMENEKPPPIGCVFQKNSSYIRLHVNIYFHHEKEFNFMRKMLQKYTYVLHKYSTPSDDITDIPPEIKLCADLNENLYLINCQHDFQFSNISNERKKEINQMLETLQQYSGISSLDLYEWL